MSGERQKSQPRPLLRTLFVSDPARCDATETDDVLLQQQLINGIGTAIWLPDDMGP